MDNHPPPGGSYASFYDVWGPVGLVLPWLQRPLEERGELRHLVPTRSRNSPISHPLLSSLCQSLGGTPTSPILVKIRDFEIGLYWHDWHLWQLCIYWWQSNDHPESYKDDGTEDRGTFLRNPVNVFVVQSLSRVRLFATPRTAAHQLTFSTYLKEQECKFSKHLGFSPGARQDTKWSRQSSARTWLENSDGDFCMHGLCRCHFQQLLF